jgi:hypothetical protein
MSKGSSGKKQGNSHKKARAMYKMEGRSVTNKAKKAKKETKRQEKLWAKGKGELTTKAILRAGEKLDE